MEGGNGEEQGRGGKEQGRGGKEQGRGGKGKGREKEREKRGRERGVDRQTDVIVEDWSIWKGMCMLYRRCWTLINLKLLGGPQKGYVEGGGSQRHEGIGCLTHIANEAFVLLRLVSTLRNHNPHAGKIQVALHVLSRVRFKLLRIRGGNVNDENNAIKCTSCGSPAVKR
eukprot:748382-Hanusia_phi.AAC.3